MDSEASLHVVSSSETRQFAIHSKFGIFSFKLFVFCFRPKALLMLRSFSSIVLVIVVLLGILTVPSTQATPSWVDETVDDERLVDFVGQLRAVASPAANASSGPSINGTLAAALNYTQFEYTLVNALLSVDPDLCLNEALTVGASNVVDLLVLCTVHEVHVGNCSEASPSAIASALAAAGWSGTNFTGYPLAAKLPASDFNWTTPIGEDGEGLRGRKAYEVGLSAAAKVIESLNATLESRVYRLAGSYAYVLRDDLVYAYVVIGNAPNQSCYTLSTPPDNNTFAL